MVPNQIHKLIPKIFSGLQQTTALPDSYEQSGDDLEGLEQLVKPFLKAVDTNLPHVESRLIKDGFEPMWLCRFPVSLNEVLFPCQIIVSKRKVPQKEQAHDVVSTFSGRQARPVENIIGYFSQDLRFLSQAFVYECRAKYLGADDEMRPVLFQVADYLCHYYEHAGYTLALIFDKDLLDLSL